MANIGLRNRWYFNWIIKNKLAGAESPYVEDLKEYRRGGFTSIISLQTGVKKQTEYNFPDYDFPVYTPQDCEENGLEFYSIPVEDGLPPTYAQMDEFIEYVDKPGRVCLVHCYAGIGRTGCMLAVYYGVKNNLSANATLDYLHKIWEAYIQTYEQVDAVSTYLDEKAGES